VSDYEGSGWGSTRRGFLATAAGLVAAVSTGMGVGAATEALAETRAPGKAHTEGGTQAEPFWGKHQGGIVTPAQSHTYFAAFDLTTSKRDAVVRLLQAWTSAAARMAEGQTAQPLDEGLKPAAGWL
jgi:deferrochelatase/peroxidase EfeB